MKIIDPGHQYLLDGVGGYHSGVLVQELLRVCIDRTKYLNAQVSCMETEMALAAMRQALAW